MALTESLTAFFNTAEFAKVAKWNGTVDVNVIFDNAYMPEQGISGTNPYITAIESEMIGAEEGQLIEIDSIQYEIASSPQPDGTGIVLIELFKKS